MATTYTHMPRRGKLRKDTFTGAAAIAASVTAVKASEVLGVTLHLSGNPTTSENFTITLNANAGAVYDTELESQDLSSPAQTDGRWLPTTPMFLEPGDALDIAYDNTDGNTYGVQVTMMEAL